MDAWSLRDVGVRFCPDGTIPIAFFNIPGSVHDSQVAHWGRVYDKLGAMYDETDGKCTVDSAFGKVNQPFLIKSSHDYLVSTMPTHQEQRLGNIISSRRIALRSLLAEELALHPLLHGWRPLNSVCSSAIPSSSP